MLLMGQSVGGVIAEAVVENIACSRDSYIC